MSEAPKNQHADPPNQAPERLLKKPRREDFLRVVDKMEQQGRLDPTKYKSKADLISAVDEAFQDNSGTTIQSRLRKFYTYYMKPRELHCEICDMNDHFAGNCPNKGKDPKDFTPFKIKCSICLKEEIHWSIHCPYLTDLPDGAFVGPSAYIVGKWSGLPRASDAQGAKCALMKCCVNCRGDHWREECPHQARLLRLTEAREKARAEAQGMRKKNFLELGRNKEDVLRDLDMLLKAGSDPEYVEKLRNLLDEVNEDDHLQEELEVLLHEDLGPAKEESVRCFFEAAIDRLMEYGRDCDDATGSYQPGEDIRMESVDRYLCLHSTRGTCDENEDLL